MDSYSLPKGKERKGKERKGRKGRGEERRGEERRGEERRKENSQMADTPDLGRVLALSSLEWTVPHSKEADAPNKS